MSDLPETPNIKPPPGEGYIIETTPQREAATRPFQVRDRVRNWGAEHTDKVRTVQYIETLGTTGSEETTTLLVVLKDEDNRVNSPEWRWQVEECELVEAAPPSAAVPAGFVIAPAADADPQRTISAMFEKLQEDFVPPAPVVNLDATYSASYVARLRAEKEEAVALAAQELQRADAESKRAEKLEKQLTELQNMIAAGQPVAVKQAVCWETKVLVQDLNELVDAERELTEHYNQGWQKDSITATTYYMFDGMASRAIHTRIVSLKRLVPTQPQRPQREASASATPAGQLTGEFVIEQMHRVEQPLNTYSALIKAYGVKEAMAMLDGHAFDNAMARHRQRVTTHPIPQRSLLSLKAGQS